MKVFAESQPPKSVPYIHLGYLATTVTRFPPGLIESGLLFGFAGALLALKLKRNPNQDPQSSPNIRLRKTRLGWAGFAVFLFGIGLCVLAFAFSKQVPAHGKSLTYDAMRQVDSEISIWSVDMANETNAVKLKAGEYNLAEFVNALPDFPEIYRTNSRYVQDAWHQPIRLQVAQQMEGWQFIYSSAGEDGKFATDDDVRFTNVLSFPVK